MDDGGDMNKSQELFDPDGDSQMTRASRRSFIGGLAVGVAGLLAAVGAGIGAGFLYPVPHRKTKPLFICLIEQLPESLPLEILSPAGRKALLFRQTNGSILAIDKTCTHLGCQIFWRQAEKRFECPCHMGIFDETGSPISGPPQRPLERYPVEIRNKKVFVTFG
jgi:cytochrome b6-f complex iron-sulfur subunit